MLHYRMKQGLDKMEDAAAIRTEVFVEEQGFQNEFDETDRTAYHIVLYEGTQAVATGRLYPAEGEGYAIGRVAVRKICRGKHAGKAVVEKLEILARTLGAKELSLDAQVRAMGFYETLGYEPFGKEHLDEFCPHRMMKKRLL